MDGTAVSEATERGGAAAAASAPVLVATKLAPPAQRPHVRRRRLTARLAGEPGQVTLIGAPAGWGKTTLLADWCAAEEETRPFAWLAIERADGDPVRFWTYLIAALQTVAQGVGAGASALLRAPGTSVADDVLPLLLNDLTALGEDVVLVLDDYHLIASPAVQDQVAYLIDRLPTSLHLVLATRVDPPLPLARLRGRAQLREVRAGDLRFAEAEAGAMLNDVLGLGLADGDVARLTNRTEGWAAGLYLAALSVRGRDDAAAFITAFAGDDRHIVDYLGGEVLAHQAEDVRSFLVRTSILERLCGELCDAVLASTGSAPLLERIEASNLFLLPLDSRRLWYRYHHLFGDLLRLELRRSDPAAIPGLHRRASAWHRAQGLVSEAIRHAIAGGDLDVAAELIAEHWNPALCEGRLATVASWLEALPTDAVARDPRLCIVGAWLALNLGELDAIEGWIQAAEQGALPGPFLDGVSSVAAAAALLRACLCQRVGDATGSVAAARDAVAMERDSRTSWCTVAHAALGVALYWADGADEADAALAEALRLASPPDDNLSYLHALGCLAALRLESGDTEAAATLLEQGEALAERYGLTEYWVTSMMAVVRGRLAAEQGELEQARDVLEHALRLARRGSGLLENAHALLSLAVVTERLGLSERAVDLLAQGRRRAGEAPAAARLAALVTATEQAVRGDGRAASAAPAPDEPLTEREAAVLRLLATELSLREIGAELFVSLNTVKTHARAIYRKLDVTTRADAVARARESGLR